MLLLHNTRETLARLHDRRIQELVHNLLSKNVTTSIPNTLYARCCYDMIQNDMVCDAMVLAFKIFAYLFSLLKNLFGSLMFELFSHAMLHEPR